MKHNKRLLLVPCIILGVITLLFLYAITIYPFDSESISGLSLESPSSRHFLGTDDIGVDIFAQVASGYFNSMLIGVLAAAVSFFLGGFVGIVSGFSGRYVDTVLSFIINIFLSSPQLPIMIVVGAFFGQHISNVILIIAFFSWARIARITRAKVISIMGSGYISMSKSFGGGFFHIFKYHLWAEVFPLLTASSIDVIGKAVIMESSLAYLGLSDPASHSWGLLIDKCLSFRGIYYTVFWTWWLLPPLISLVVVILCIRLISQQLEVKMI